MSRSIDQASGIVAVHADCSIEAAVKLMEARAAATGRSLEHIAEAVLDGGKRKYLVRRTPDARWVPGGGVRLRERLLPWVLPMSGPFSRIGGPLMRGTEGAPRIDRRRLRAAGEPRCCRG
jgi:hypothetical protein